MVTGWKLDPAPPQRDGVVPSDHALIAAGQDVIDVTRGGPPSGVLGAGRLSEAAIVVGDECGKERVGLFHRGDGVESQLGHQSILKDGPHPFDPAFGLRALGGNEGNAEFLEDEAKVSGRLAAGQLLFERPVIVGADQRGEAIAIQSQRHSVAVQDVMEELDVAMEVFVSANHERQDLSGGIVDSSLQSEERMILPEPPMLTAVDQDQGPAARLAFPANAVLRRPTTTLGGKLRGQSDPSHQLARDWHVLDLAELFREVVVVQPCIGGRHQLQDSLAPLSVETTRRGSATGCRAAVQGYPAFGRRP